MKRLKKEQYRTQMSSSIRDYITKWEIKNVYYNNNKNKEKNNYKQRSFN